jgi:HEPN domain-containing protein
LADRLTALYIAERYPDIPSIDYLETEIAALLEQAEKFIAFIKEKAG